MTSKIEMGKQYRTRDGRAVRILCVDRHGSGLWPVIGLLTGKDGKEYMESWPESGRLDEDKTRTYDLIEVKPRITGQLWVNVYPNRVVKFIAHPTKALAEDAAGFERVACVPIIIDCEEGAGLDK